MGGTSDFSPMAGESIAASPPPGYRLACGCHWLLAREVPVAYRLDEWCQRHRQVVLDQGGDPDRPLFRLGVPDDCVPDE